MAFCDQFKKLRKRKGIKQNDLADMLGVKQYVISSWETGRSEPNISQICKLADILEIPTDYLLDCHTILVADSTNFQKVEKNIKMDIEDNVVRSFQIEIVDLTDAQKTAILDIVKSLTKLIKK